MPIACTPPVGQDNASSEESDAAVDDGEADGIDDVDGDRKPEGEEFGCVNGDMNGRVGEWGRT